MVVFQIDDLTVYFPYDFIYPEQYAYMQYLKKTLDSEGHAVLEMPTGTGKTIALFSLITSYQLQKPELGRLIYCTRTVPEMEKALQELKYLIEYRDQIFEQEEESLKKTISEMKTSKIETVDIELSNKSNENEKIEIKNNLIDTSLRHKNKKILAIGLSARRNLCIHPRVSQLAHREEIDEQCRQLTAPWIREDVLSSFKKSNNENDISNPASTTSFPDLEDLGMSANEEEDENEASETPTGSSRRRQKLCPYFENYKVYWASEKLLDYGVYTIESFKNTARKWIRPKTGKKRPYCPYFAARRFIASANVVVLNYQYVLHPKVSEVSHLAQGILVLPGSAEAQAQIENIDSNETILSKNTQKNLIKTEGPQKEMSVLVFDEAHNIDNVCIEALSVNINKQTLECASRNLLKLENSIEELKAKDLERLTEEYKKLVEEHARTQLETETENTDTNPFTSGLLNNPVLPEHIVKESIPGNIRKASHFLNIMKTIISYFKKYIRTYEVKSEGLMSMIFNLEQATGIEGRILKFAFDRLKSLLNTLKTSGLEEFTPLLLVADLCTLAGTYYVTKSQSFVVIVEPYPEATGLYDPVLQFCCLDASLAMEAVLKRYQSVILTSGTISPLDLYPRLLGFVPVVTESFPMSLDRRCLCPLIVGRGADQIPLSSRFEQRNDISVIHNYGTLLESLAKTVPDGLVCFFTSYIYMEQVLSQWYDSGLLARVLEHKLIFMETKDVVSTTLALHNFRQACDRGRGAVFLSIARGKVAEGIDFDRHYGRAVVLFGVPYQYTLSKVLKARLHFMREKHNIQEADFLTFDAMRQAAQCVGRVIRSKFDYGLMIFADARYSRNDKLSKLPPWILKYLDSSSIMLTVQTATSVVSSFLKNMCQPYELTKSTRLDSTVLSNPVAARRIVNNTLGLKVLLNENIDPTSRAEEPSGSGGMTDLQVDSDELAARPKPIRIKIARTN